jgi:hypothetical protein
MNKSKLLLFAITLALIGAVGAGLVFMRERQRLGKPGVKTTAIPNSGRLRVELPEKVLDYTSEWHEPDEVTTNTLPPDTSFGARSYAAPDGFQLMAQVVLMGNDRTSLHKPQFCLEGQGIRIDDFATVQTKIHIGGTDGYELPVVKLEGTRIVEKDGAKMPVRYLYVYWYAADGVGYAGTAGFGRMFLMAKEVLATGVLQRWAYISCLTACEPGREAAAFERLKQFIAAAVPQFQYPPKSAGSALASASGKP